MKGLKGAALNYMQRNSDMHARKMRYLIFQYLKEAYVCRETIYTATYARPVGELRKELIICLRQGKT